MSQSAKSTTDVDVYKVASLARLTLNDAEALRIGAQLNAVLEYVALLKEVDVEGVAPTSHPLPLSTAFREDRAMPGLNRDVVLAGAPQTDGESFTVPKVV